MTEDEVQTLLKELVEMGHAETIEQDGETLYRITEAGKKAAELLFETEVEPTSSSDLNMLLN